MAIQPVPDIDPAPTPGPQRGDESTFDDRMDASIRWFEVSPAQFKALGDNVAFNANEALTYATNAQTYMNNTIAYRDAALGYRDQAQGYSLDASGFATAAAASAAAAANSATALTATSTSSNTPGTGTKTFTVQAGRQFIAGGPIYVVDSANSANFMSGTVTSYSGTTLVVDSTSFGGGGTITSWNITVSGARGAQGATGGVAGGNLTGQLVELKGASIAAAATTNVWAVIGNSATLTGTTTITSFGTAPQAGAKFTLVAGAVTPLTHGANLVLPGGMSYTTAVDDLIEIYADTTTRFIVSITKKDGTAVTAPAPYNKSELLTASGTFTARVTGWHKFTLKGADGSGGAATTAGGTQCAAAASGGGGGGMAISNIFCTAGSTYTFVAGAGGPGVVRNNGAALGAVSGNAGGTSTVTGTGLSLTANGGAGGNAAAVTSGTATAAGAAGGTATGGQVNIQGATSGTATALASGVGASGNMAATGGVAMPWRGVAYGSGNATVNNAAATNCAAGSGGSGIGGISGSVTNTGATNISVQASGGGSRGASASVSSATTVNNTTVGVGIPQTPFAFTFTEPPFELIGAGAAPGTAPAGPGGGTGAILDNNQGDGAFGGGCGAVLARAAASTAGGNGRYGSSGGAVMLNNFQLNTGNGGGSFLLVEFTS